MNYKNYIKGLLSVFFIFVFIFSIFTKVSFATVTPTLSLSGTGDGDSVQLNVTGDPNTSVLFIYTKLGSVQQVNSIGTTNASGALATTISSSSYGIPSGSLVHVALGNINGPQSPNVSWPLVSATISSTNMLSLSQTGLVMSIGQSATVTASNIGSSSLYLSNNSSPVIANFNISGSQITVLANSYGSTTGTFCLVNNSSNCGSIYVMVQNVTADPLTFSQSSVSLSSGQTISIQISGGTGNYLVLNNSSQNSGVVATSISGSNITLTTNSTSGSSSITVCSTSMTSCGIINVSIGTASSTAISFSQTNPTVSIAQSLNISIFGPTNSLFYVASSSNPNVVQANLSGNTLTLLGITNGSSVVNVCVSTTNCTSLTVTVNSNSVNNGPLALSQYGVTLSSGQSTTVTISGGSMPYNISSNTNNLVQTILNGNIITLTGLSGGLDLINVCSASGNCVTLSVTINGVNNTNYVPATVNTPVYTQPSTVPSDCNGAVYSILTGRACPSSTVINNINNSQNNSSSVSNSNTEPASSTKNTTIKSTAFKFTKLIKLGSSGAEVTELQKKLKTLGFYKGKIDGKFGSALAKSVKAFQKKYKLSQTGSTGPKTRALLNAK